MFEKMLQESLNCFHHDPTKIVDVQVISVDRHKVVVDAGLHVEGIIPRTEFIELPVVGDTLRIVIEALDDGEGQLKIAFRDVMYREQLDSIPAQIISGKPVDCKVIEVTRAGLILQAGYLSGFMPKSQIDVSRVTNPEYYLGQSFPAKILSLDPLHKNLILSRKMAILDKCGGIVPMLTRPPEVNDVYNGKVIGIKRFGLFVDIGGMSPLLHISDLSWDVLSANPESFVIGDRIQVIVKHHNQGSNRYCLSIKHLDMETWEQAKTDLPVDSVQQAKVVKVEECGDILVVVGGVSGIVRNKDVAWTRMTNSSINSAFRRGAEFEVKVLGFDDDKGFENILLSRKACVENPWEHIRKNLKEGDVIETRIKSVGEKMVFVGIHEDIAAIVHAREIGSTNGVDDTQGLKIDDAVKVVITSINIEDRRISASIKSAKEGSPFLVKKGQELKCKISSISNGGDISVKFIGEKDSLPMFGIILARNVTSDKTRTASDMYEKGQELNVVALNVYLNGVINLNIATAPVVSSSNKFIPNNAFAMALAAAKA